mgnify:CR=1 FL=1|jgi:hypothetical protein
MAGDWFETLMGFTERAYEETQRNLEVSGTVLRSRVNGRTYGIGRLEIPTLAELRSRALEDRSATGEIAVSGVAADVSRLHRDPANRHALFQVASQFNLLEMTGPEVTPEDGVARYARDHTQGPACARAAGAATIYRNYCVPVAGHTGQTRTRQVNCLADVGAALGNDGGALWAMRNGYALCTPDGLDRVRQTLAGMTAGQRDALRDLLRVGVHWDVEVTSAERPDQLVSQVFCSALPVSYTSIPAPRWEPFAALVLEGAYEATLWAAAVNARRSGSNVVYLTRLGGGAFGNEPRWIHAAIGRAVARAREAGLDLDVRVVSHGPPSPELSALIDELRQRRARRV